MAHVFEGVIRTILPLEHIPFADGSTQPRRRVEISTVEEFPESMLVTLKNQLAEQFSMKEGEAVKAYLNFRTFKSKNGDVFNQIQCWKMEKGGTV